jgi:hypothetical protein
MAKSSTCLNSARIPACPSSKSKVGVGSDRASGRAHCGCVTMNVLSKLVVPAAILTIASAMAAAADDNEVLIGAATSFSGWMAAFDTSPTHAAEIAIQGRTATTLRSCACTNITAAKSLTESRVSKCQGG